jgi:ADP-ribose pyrophosphatase YjhB (NUDIX family)
MELVVKPELQAYIAPLTADEHEALERSLLAEGCRDALVLWGDVLVDGHNRYGICRKHGLPFQTVQNPRFKSLEDVQLWMIDQHLGRRSLSDFQRGELALRKRAIVAERRARAEDPSAADSTAAPLRTPSDDEALATREALAKAAKLSNSQVVMIEKIQKQAVPEVVAAVKAGALSISAAAAVASLPADAQSAAAAAGPDQLKSAARQVREAKRRAPKTTGGEAYQVVPPAAATTPLAPAAAGGHTAPWAEAEPAPQVGVGVLVLRDGQVLLGQRQGAHGAGTWAAPGGHLQFGESFADCARREVAEETGLHLLRTQAGPCTNDVMADEGRHYVTVFVVAQAAQGDVQLMEPDKCSGWQWFDWQALPQPLFLPLQHLVEQGYVPPASV